MFTEERHFLQIAVHPNSAKSMEQEGGLVQLVWFVCFDEILRRVATVEMNEKTENVTTLLNIFSKHGVKALPDLAKERLKD